MREGSALYRRTRNTETWAWDGDLALKKSVLEMRGQTERNSNRESCFICTIADSELPNRLHNEMNH